MLFSEGSLTKTHRENKFNLTRFFAGRRLFREVRSYDTRQLGVFKRAFQASEGDRRCAQPMEGKDEEPLYRTPDGLFFHNLSHDSLITCRRGARG
jgi:hypothetical protein